MERTETNKNDYERGNRTSKMVGAIFFVPKSYYDCMRKHWNRDYKLNASYTKTATSKFWQGEIQYASLFKQPSLNCFKRRLLF